MARADAATQLAENLRGISGISVIAEGAGFRVRCEKTCASALVDPARVTRTKHVVDPFGDTSLLLLLNDNGRSFQAVISPSDLVFEPDEAVAVGDFDGPRIRVGNIPGMVGYSEVLRELTFWESAVDDEPELDRLFGSMAMLRYFIAGAARLGMDDRELVARWNQLWNRFEQR